jgi:hypothetical protein
VKRFRWRLTGLREWLQYSADGRIVAGLVAALLLAGGGFFVGRDVAGNSASSGVLWITTRHPVTKTITGHKVVPFRRKGVKAQPSTSYQPQTIHTPSGTEVLTQPVVRYRPLYRKKVVTRNGRTTTVVSNQTTTNKVTTTAVQGATEPVAVGLTTTVVSTEIAGVPIAVTVTVPRIP